jgi:hypothetical protein
VIFVVLKTLLGARDDAKEGRRPLERKMAWGDAGGLTTPFVPFSPFKLPDSLDEAMAGEVEVLSTKGDDVYEVIEAWVETADTMENGGEDVSASILRRVLAAGVIGATRSTF